MAFTPKHKRGCNNFQISAKIQNVTTSKQYLTSMHNLVLLSQICQALYYLEERECKKMGNRYQCLENTQLSILK